MELMVLMVAASSVLSCKRVATYWRIGTKRAPGSCRRHYTMRRQMLYYGPGLNLGSRWV